MVGEREMSILRSKNVTNSFPGNEDMNCSYSRYKMEKKTNSQADDNSANINDIETFEHQILVDNFVQEIIKRAKSEYLRQCPKLNDENGVKSRDSAVVQRLHEDADGSNETPTQDKKSHKSNKNRSKHSKRQPKYKYSDPVDEKEISKYEHQQQQTDPLLEWNPNFGKHSERRESLHGFYHRLGTSARRLFSCCFSKS